LDGGDSKKLAYAPIECFLCFHRVFNCNYTYLQIQDHNTDTSSVLFEPEVYAEANGSVIQPVSLKIPSEVLRSAFKDLTLETSAVRTVFMLHRTSILFPSSERSNWVWDFTFTTWYCRWCV